MNITPEIVRELLHYDPDTGIFTWRERDRKWFKTQRACSTWNKRYAGCRAGAIWTNPATGYQRRQINVLCKLLKEHRLAWMWMTDDPLPEQLDHRNRDATDNRWRNLRASTNAKNGLNQSMKRNNSSGITGVSWSKVANKWHARCKTSESYKSLGYFDDINEAAAAIQAFRAKHGYDAGHGAELPHYA